MKKSTEISPGLILHTTDRIGANRSVVSIEYELEVRKNKLVIFEIDFTGSTNLELEGGGYILSKKTMVEPGKRALVAVVHVIDQTKSWSLETKYTWVEENPGTVQPGQSKREKLAEGLILTTSRMSSPDTFSFHLLNEKNVSISVMLDCSKSVNLSMVAIDEPGTFAQKDISRVHHNVISVTIPAFARAHVCSLVVKDPTIGYQLKTKWSWAESSSHFGSLLEPHSASPGRPWSDSLENMQSYSKIGTKPLPYQTNPSSFALIPQDYSQDIVARSSSEPHFPGRPPRSSPSRPRLKREEISTSVFLETEIIDNMIRAEVLYSIQVAKETRVTFEADFSGSVNLGLVPSGGLVCEAVVEPMRKMQVARLRVLDPTVAWRLVCRYKWQEEDIIPQSELLLNSNQPLMIQNQPSAVVNQPRSSSAGGDVRALLRTLNLEAYAEFFEAEELTLDLLRIMARDEAEFRHSLESLGVNKMGHREKILVAVKNLPLISE